MRGEIRESQNCYCQRVDGDFFGDFMRVEPRFILHRIEVPPSPSPRGGACARMENVALPMIFVGFGDPIFFDRPAPKRIRNIRATEEAGYPSKRFSMRDMSNAVTSGVFSAKFTGAIPGPSFLTPDVCRPLMLKENPRFSVVPPCPYHMAPEGGVS